jgi:hypothetical protein
MIDNPTIKMENIMNVELLQEYKGKIEPILPSAKRANGSRSKVTPEHDASRLYTKLLIEYKDKGGSLPKLADALGVAYSGVRRRVIMDTVSVEQIKPIHKIAISEEDIRYATQRVQQAKLEGISEYHDQLAQEYKNGIPMATLAKSLGLSGAAPLYYGVQRSIQRNR